MLDLPKFNYAAVELASIEAYNQGIRILQGNRLGKTDEDHVTALLRFMEPPKSAHILDIGCGFGEVTRIMKGFRPDLEFTCLTNSQTQFTRLPDGTDALLMNMHNLHIPNETYDGAMFLYSLCHADIQVALKEAARVVAPGGFLFIYDYTRYRGGNLLAETHLGARFHYGAELHRKAEDAGWRCSLAQKTGGDDSLFRSLMDPDQYDAIFEHLQPMVWRFDRVGAH